MEVYIVMIPESRKVIEAMALGDIGSASALAQKAGISPTSARKVIRGEVVSLGVAQKVTRALSKATPRSSVEMFDLFSTLTSETGDGS